MSNKLDNALCAYVQTALWSSHDESDESGGEPMDSNYSYDDLSEDCLKTMRADLATFLKKAGALICLENFKGRAYYGSVSERAAHDFWLTQNHHGAGFWDGDWEEPAATKLTEISQSFPERALIVGEDGKIHIM